VGQWSREIERALESFCNGPDGDLGFVDDTVFIKSCDTKSAFYNI
jgi:hypothetical protein